MIDHVTIKVKNLHRSRQFYEEAFRPLNYTVCFGEEGIFWAFDIEDGLYEIMQVKDVEAPLTGFHLAFRVKSRALVDAFYEAAIAAGGRDNGQPGPRPQYTPNYYACFVFDPDGHNIEAMCDIDDSSLRMN